MSCGHTDTHRLSISFPAAQYACFLHQCQGTSLTPTEFEQVMVRSAHGVGLQLLMLQLEALVNMRLLNFCQSGGQQPDLALVSLPLAWTGLGCIMQLWTQKIKVIQVKQPVDKFALPAVLTLSMLSLHTSVCNNNKQRDICNPYGCCLAG